MMVPQETPRQPRPITALEPILRAAVAAGASDVHLRAGAPPAFRIDTLLGPAAMPALSIEQLTNAARVAMTDRPGGDERDADGGWNNFCATGDADFALDVPALGRFRVNVHRQRGSVAIAIRVIRAAVPRLSSLFLPEICERFTEFDSGLVLVTGGSGSGKSTTLAGMIDSINRREHGHIVTLEDPIEMVFDGERCVIEQREIGSDTPSFAAGLRHVLRQDPDTILVGEMRDLETTAAAMTAAETGHRVLSTLHTAGAAETVERIVDLYPGDQQHQIRGMLAGSLRAVISQTLLRRADGPGLAPVAEIMVCTSAVRSCIRDNRMSELRNLIDTGRAVGMQSKDAAIRQLLEQGVISREIALANCTQPERLTRQAA